MDFLATGFRGNIDSVGCDSLLHDPFLTVSESISSTSNDPGDV